MRNQVIYCVKIADVILEVELKTSTGGYEYAYAVVDGQTMYSSMITKEYRNRSVDMSMQYLKGVIDGMNRSRTNMTRLQLINELFTTEWSLSEANHEVQNVCEECSPFNLIYLAEAEFHKIYHEFRRCRAAFYQAQREDAADW